MPRALPEEIRVLAIHPTSKGLGFAVFEAPSRLVDWGTKVARGDNRRSLSVVEALLVRYRPDVVVTEEPEGSRRSARVRRLLDRIWLLTKRRKVRCRRYSRWAVRKAFVDAGPITKHQIATTIASRFPELRRSLPPRRKPWMSEDERMSAFDAAAFALRFLETGEERSDREHGSVA